MNKENDWFAANLNRPDFGFEQMFASGITPDNTTLKDKDYYKGIKQVQNKFTDNTGKFNEDSFNNYYDGLKRSYNEFSTIEFEKKLLNNMESSPYDIFSIDNPTSFDATVKMIRNSDPQRHQMGMSGVNVIGEPSWDEREVAQENWVRDENGNKLNWTPNKKWLGNIFGPTLVKATWDEDGYHDENGQQVFHQKGQAKYDENGDPYYELLGNRSIYGKDVLHVSDIITKDDSWINNLGFIDSDSIDKSAMKTIFKTAATIGMWAIPYVGPWLGGIKAAMDLTSVLPIVGKSIDSFINGDTNNDFGKTMNQWEGIMARFDRSQTQYAKEHPWAFENIGDMLASSAGQLYSQRLIGQIPLLFKNNAKDLGKLQKIGQRLSLGYMALTSAEDSYRDFKDAGANDVTAGLGFLATASAMFGLMNIDYFKAWLFKNSNLGFDPEMRFAWRDFSKEKVKEISEEMAKSGLSLGKKAMSETETKFWLKKWWNAAKNFVKTYSDKIPTGKAYPMTAVFANRAVNEGFEEVIEEGFTDIVKGLSLAAQELGLEVSESDKNLDFGFSAEEMFNRYLTSFVGGALGGTVFEGLTRWENYWKGGFGKTDNLLDKSAKNRLLWYIANEYGKDLKAALDQEHRRGHLGDKNLTFDFEETTDAAGNKKWVSKPVSANGENQNDQMYRRLSDMLNTLEYQAATLGILDSDDDIRDHILQNDDLAKVALQRMQEAAAREGITLNEFKRKHLTSLSMQTMAEDGVMDAIFSDIYSLKDRILNIQSAIDARISEIREGETDSNRAIKDSLVDNDPALKRWKQQLKEAQDTYKDIMSGNRASEYIGLAYFSHNNALRNLYLTDKEGDLKANTDEKVYALQRYGVNFDSLSDSDKDFIKREHSQFITLQRNPLIREAYNIHKNMMGIVNNVLSEKKSEYEGFKIDKGLESSTVIQYLAQQLQVAQITLQNLQNERATTADGTPEAIELDNNIDQLTSAIDAYNNAIQNSNIDELNRAISVNEGSTFGESLPMVFAHDANIHPEKFKDALRTLNDYLNYLKQNKIILGEDNPVFGNVIRNIARGYLNAVNDEINTYTRSAVYAELNEIAKETLDKIDEIINSEISDDVEFIDESLLTNDTVREFGLPLYIAKITQQLRWRRSNNIELSEEEATFLSARENLSDEEINNILDKNGDIYRNFQAKREELNTESFNDHTRNIFLEDRYKGEQNLEGKYMAVYNSLLNNASDLDEKLNDLRTYITNTINGEVEQNDLLNKLVVPLENISSQITSAIATRGELKPSPISDLFDWVNMQISGVEMPLIDFIRNEYKGITTKEALDKYQFANQDVRNQLRRIQTIFPIIKAILASSRPGSFNEEMNIFREKDDVDLLTVLDDDQYIMWVDELRYIENRIKQLSALDGANAQSNSDKQIEDQLKMRPKFLRRFIGDVQAPGLPKELKEIGIDVNDIWEKIIGDSDFSTITRDNYKEYFEAVIKWESEVYDKFWQVFNGQTEYEIGKALGKCFSNLVNDGGAYSGNDDEIVTDMAAALYFLSVIGYKDFQGLYKSKLNRNEDYPFDNQEMAIRIGFNAVLHSDLYNGIMSNLKSHSSDDGTVTAGMSKLDNILAILGENGTGKSKICTTWIIDLLKASGKKVGVVGTTAFGTETDGRLSEMKAELGLDDAHIIPLSEVITIINNGNQFGPDDYIQLTNTDVTRPGKLSEERLSKITSDKLNEKYASDDELKILALDEGTFASEAELQAISKACKEAGIFVILTGDLGQQYSVIQYNTYDRKGNKTGIAEDSSGLEDCLYGATPRLTASMRVAYQGKRANGILLNSIVNKGVSNYKNDPTLSTDEILSPSENISVDLMYHDTGSGFYGDGVIESNDVIDTIKKFDRYSQDSPHKKPNVVIITDNEDKYSALASDNIVIYKPNEVQGREFDYAVVDVDLSKDIYKPFFTRIKGINTWLSRARNGAVIVNKEQLNESNFKFKSHDDPNAAIEIDSIIARPEEIDAYKDFVDNNYSSVTVNTPVTPQTIPPILPPQEAPAAVPDEVIDPGKGYSVDPNKSADEVRQEVIDEVMNGKSNNNGYLDEDHYREHNNILTDSNIRSGMTYNGYSLESFWRWLYSPESDAILFKNSSWNPVKENLTDEQKVGYKRLIRNIVFTIASNDSMQSRIDAIRDKSGTLTNLATGLFKNINGVQFVDSLISALSGNDGFSVFKVISDKKDSSSIWFVFGKDKPIAIPMGSTTKPLSEGVYKDIKFGQRIPLSIITSNGRLHVPVGYFDEKLHRHTNGGIFIAPSLDSIVYGELSNAARNFAKSRGRTFGVYDLDFNDNEDTNSIFTPQLDSRGKIIDFTSIGSGETNGATTRIAGVQAIIAFEKYIEVAKALQTVAFDYGATIENRSAAIKILKTYFGLNDETITILSTPSTSSRGSDIAETNRTRYDILRDCELLNYVARGRFASALFRIASKWFALEPSNPKFKFASKLLSNLATNYIVQSRGNDFEVVEKHGAEGKYTQGLRFNLNGTGDSGNKVTLDLFVYADKNGELYFEEAEDRLASTDARFKSSSIGNVKNFLSGEKGIDFIALTKAVVSYLNSNPDLNTRPFNDIFKANDEELSNFINEGFITFLPGKRYDKQPKDRNKQASVIYYNGFDSDLANLIPDNHDGVYAELDKELRSDSIFRYGLYISERSGIFANPNVPGEQNSFAMINLNEGRVPRTIDIADMMLPMYEISISSFETDNNVLSKLSKFGNFGQRIEGAVSNESVIAIKNNNTYTFGNNSVFATVQQLSKLLDNESLKKLIDANVISDNKPLEIISLSLDGSIKYRLGNEERIASLTFRTNDVDNWIRKLGIADLQVTGVVELSPRNDSGWIVAKDGTLFLNYRNKVGNDSDILERPLDVIGYSVSKNNTGLYYVRNGNNIVEVEIDPSNLDPNTTNLLSKIIRGKQDYGKFVLNDNNGWYFYKDGLITFIENDFGVKPKTISIINITDNEILLSDGIIITRESDEALFKTIQSNAKKPVMINSAILRRLGNTLWVVGSIKLNSDFLAQNYIKDPNAEYDGGDVSIVNISDDNSLLVRDSSGNSFVIKSDSNLLEGYLNNINREVISDKISRFISRPEFDPIRDQLLELVALDQNLTDLNAENSLIDEMNSILDEFAPLLGAKYSIKQGWKLVKSTSPSDAIMIAIENYDFGQKVINKNIPKIIGNSVEFLVTLQDGTEQKYIASFKTNGTVDINLIPDLSQISSLVQQVKQIISTIQEENVKSALLSYVEAISIGNQISDELDDIITNLQFSDNPQIKEIFKLTDQINEQIAC